MLDKHMQRESVEAISTIIPSKLKNELAGCTAGNKLSCNCDLAHLQSYQLSAAYHALEH